MAANRRGDTKPMTIVEVTKRYDSEELVYWPRVTWFQYEVPEDDEPGWERTDKIAAKGPGCDSFYEADRWGDGWLAAWKSGPLDPAPSPAAPRP